MASLLLGVNERNRLLPANVKLRGRLKRPDALPPRSASMSSSTVSGAPQRPDFTFWDIADRLELMAQALKALSDPIIKQHIIREMRTLLVEAEHKLLGLKHSVGPLGT